MNEKYIAELIFRELEKQDDRGRPYTYLDVSDVLFEDVLLDGRFNLLDVARAVVKVVT